MTVSDIITAAKQYTQITGSAWFSDADALRSINRAYRDVYEKILDSNDEYFIKETSVLSTALSPVRDYIYEYTLPDDWYRLRRFTAIIPTGERILERVDPQDIFRYEGYRYFGDKMRIYFRDNYSSFRLEYYPAPKEYTGMSDDIVYPPQLEPLILAYRMAIDIVKAQNGDPAKHTEEYLALWNRFDHATQRRDNFKFPRVANVYRSSYPGW